MKLRDEEELIAGVNGREGFRARLLVLDNGTLAQTSVQEPPI